MKRRLHVVPDSPVLVEELGPLDPGGWGHARSISNQQYRIVGARVTAAFARSRLERLVRRLLPGAGKILDRIFLERDIADCARATAAVKIDRVSVGDVGYAPSRIADLPIASAGTEISVRVTNSGDRPVVARVLVEGVTL